MVEAEREKQKLYDFSDWQIGDVGLEVLLDIVRENLREAFDKFARGHWRVAWNRDASDNPAALEWAASFSEEFDDAEPDPDVSFITLRPEQLRDALLAVLESDMCSEASFDAGLEAWRAALDVVAEAWSKRQRRRSEEMAKSTAGLGPKGKAKVATTMHEWGKGALRSGSAKGPVVKAQDQAVAIALNQARKVSRAKGS